MHSPAPEAAALFKPRPEQTFFADPELDRALGIVMALATEVYVLRDRVFALERELAGNGVLDRERLCAAPIPAEAAEAQADREAFVRHLMTPVLGLQASRGTV